MACKRQTMARNSVLRSRRKVYTLKIRKPNTSVAPPKLSTWASKRSRIYASDEDSEAKPVGIYTKLDATYIRDSKETYFNQMFMKLSILGEGSFGVVHLCRSRSDNQLYAIKKIKFNQKNKYQEILNLETVHGNPFCLNYINAWFERQHLFIQFEPGLMSLGQFSKKYGLLVESQCIYILYDICRGLNFLHSSGFCHGDIKPDNILAMEDGTYKLCDFDQLTMIGDRFVNLGDNKYVSKEVVKNFVASSEGDMFSLGMTILELKVSFDPPVNCEDWNLIRMATYRKVPRTEEYRLSNKMIDLLDWMLHPITCKRAKAVDIINFNYVITMLALNKRKNHVKEFLDYLKDKEKENSVVIDLSCDSESFYTNSSVNQKSPSTPVSRVSTVILVNPPRKENVSERKTPTLMFSNPVKLF